MATSEFWTVTVFWGGSDMYQMDNRYINSLNFLRLQDFYPKLPYLIAQESLANYVTGAKLS